MKVLFVNQILAHYRTDVLTLIDRDERLDSVFLAGTDDSGVERIRSGVLGDVRSVRNMRVGRFTWQAGVMRHLFRVRPDAVVCEGDASVLSTWVLAAVARLMGVRTLFWTIGWRQVDRVGVRQARMMFYRLANKLLVYGERGRELGISSGYPASRITVVGNSVSDHEASEMSPLPNTSLVALSRETMPVAVAVARVTTIKRFDLLVDAAALAGDRGRPFAIALAGEGPEQGVLEEAARAAGVRLHMLGPIYSNAELARLYEHASLTVLPKAAGLTAIQSLAHGIPVITDDDHVAQVPEADAIVPGITGDRYRAEDVPDLEATIHAWIEKMRDHRESVETACRAEVDRYWTPQAHAARISAGILAEGRP